MARISRFEVAGILLTKTILLFVALAFVVGIAWAVHEGWKLRHDPSAAITVETNNGLKGDLENLQRKRDLLDVAVSHASFRLTNTNLLNGIFSKALSPASNYRLLSLKLTAQPDYRQNRLKETTDAGKAGTTRILSFQVEARWRLRGTADREYVRGITDEVIRRGRPDFDPSTAFEPWVPMLHTDTSAAPGSSVDDEIYDVNFVGTMTPPDGEPYRLQAGKTSTDRWRSLDAFFSEGNK